MSTAQRWQCHPAKPANDAAAVGSLVAAPVLARQGSRLPQLASALWRGSRWLGRPRASAPIDVFAPRNGEHQEPALGVVQLEQHAPASNAQPVARSPL